MLFRRRVRKAPWGYLCKKKKRLLGKLVSGINKRGKKRSRGSWTSWSKPQAITGNIFCTLWRIGEKQQPSTCPGKRSDSKLPLESGKREGEESQSTRVNALTFCGGYGHSFRTDAGRYWPPSCGSRWSFYSRTSTSRVRSGSCCSPSARPPSTAC